MKKTAIALLSLSALLLAGCGSSPESSVENYFRALEKGDMATAKNFFSQQVKNQLGDGKLTSVVTMQMALVQECGGIKELSVKLSGEGDIRTGTQIVSFKKAGATCRTETNNIKLIKEKDGWKFAG